MKLLGADANFRTQSKLGAVGESGAGIDEHRSSVHLIEEAQRGRIVLGNYSLGVAGPLCLDVAHGIVKGIDHLDRGD